MKQKPAKGKQQAKGKAVEQKPEKAKKATAEGKISQSFLPAGKKASVQQQLASEEILLYPLISEKAVNMIEAENKLCFVVNKKATKADVRKAVEEGYSIKVDGVRVVNDRKGRKKAIVKVNKKFKADEVATKLGII